MVHLGLRILIRARTLKAVGVFSLTLLGAAGAAGTAAASAPSPYQAIVPSMEDRTVVLTGRDLSIDQVVQVARYGAKVELTAEARQRSADAHALLLEAAAEGVSVYWFNRGSGSGRERFIFTGDPSRPDNKKFIEAAAARHIPPRRARRFGPGSQRGGNRPRHDGGAGQHHEFRGCESAAHATPAGFIEPSDHPGGAVARHGRRRRSGSIHEYRRDHGGRRQRLLSRRAHAGGAGPESRQGSRRWRRSVPTTANSRAPMPTPPVKWR